jgi:hypothetical protein
MIVLGSPRPGDRRPNLTPMCAKKKPPERVAMVVQLFPAGGLGSSFSASSRSMANACNTDS